MFHEKIKEVIPESNIICVSPHYDDFLFFLGGYVLEMKEKGLLSTKKFMNVSTFSRTNYQERDAQGNKDQSLKRVKYATGIRFVEDLECLDDLLGPHNYYYRVMGEEESQVRGKIFNEGEGEMEMAYGSYDTLDVSDKQILLRMRGWIEEMGLSRDTAIVLPLAMKGHIDHFIVREAGMQAAINLGPDAEATFYFAEDKPYAGLLGEEEMKETQTFIEKNGLKDIAFKHHPNEVLHLAFLHYPSQVDDVYNVGIRARNEQLKKIYGTKWDADRIFKLKK